MRVRRDNSAREIPNSLAAQKHKRLPAGNAQSDPFYGPAEFLPKDIAFFDSSGNDMVQGPGGINASFSRHGWLISYVGRKINFKTEGYPHFYSDRQTLHFLLFYNISWLSLEDPVKTCIFPGLSGLGN